MTEIIFIYLFFTIITLVKWGKIKFRNLEKELTGDSLAHYSHINSIIEHKGKIPLEHKRGPVGKHKLTYPKGYHWLVSKFPVKLRHFYLINHTPIIGFISYTIYSIFFIQFLGVKNISFYHYFLFSVLYIFAPYTNNYMEARNYFSVRPIGEFLISIAFLIYVYPDFINSANLQYPGMFVLFSGAVFISIFARQVLLFSLLPISLLNSDLYYFFTICAAFFTLAIFSRSFRLCLRGQYYHLKFFDKILLPIALKEGWIPYGLKKLLQVKDIKNFVKVFPRVNVLTLFFDYPAVWYSLVHGFLFAFRHQDFYFISVVCLIAILTSIGKFKIVGEGKRYLDYVYIMAIFYSVLNGDMADLCVIAGYSICSSLLYKIIKFVIDRRKRLSSRKEAVHDLIAFIRNLKPSIFYCLSHRMANYVESFSEHRMLTPAGIGPWNNESIEFISKIRYNINNKEIDHVLRTERIKELKKEFQVDTILIDRNYSLENENHWKKIFSNEFFRLYKV